MRKSMAWFWMAFGAFVLSSGSVILMMTALPERTGVPIVAITFWGGCLLGILSYLAALRLRPKGRDRLLRHRWFFATKAAAAVDLLLMMALLLLLLSLMDIIRSPVMDSIILFSLVFSFYAHWLFNGQVYRMHIKLRKRG